MSTDDTTTTRERSRDDRIEAAQRGRLDDIAALIEMIEADDDSDTLADLPLSTWRVADGCGVPMPTPITALLSLAEPLTPETREASAVWDKEHEIGRFSDKAYAPLSDMLGESGDDVAEAAREALQEYGLSIDVERTVVVRWVFGTGGPHDEVEMTMERERHGWSIDSAAFVFKDWFDGARSPLTGADRATIERAADIIGITEPGVVITDDAE